MASRSAASATRSMSSSSVSNRRAQVLNAQINDARVLATLLKPIAISAVASVSVSEAGLRVVTEQDRCVQAVAYVSAAVFSRFEFNPPSVEASYADDDDDAPQLDFDINLNTLLECINIFGGTSGPASSSSWQQQKDARGKRFGGGAGNTWQPATAAPYEATTRQNQDFKPATTVQMRWKGIGSPLILVLEEQDVVTRCELATYEPGHAWGLAYNHKDTQAQAIMASECLLDAMGGIDAASCSKVTLFFSNTYHASSRHSKRPRLGSSSTQGSMSNTASTSLAPGRPIVKISSDGDYGTAETELPNTASVLEKFSCAKETAHSYRHSHFARLGKALQASIRVSLRVSDRGLLSAQLMMPHGTGDGKHAGKGGGSGAASHAPGGHGFLEFLIAPLDEDFDPDEQGGDSDRHDGSVDGVGDDSHDSNEDGRAQKENGSRRRSLSRLSSASMSPTPPPH